VLARREALSFGVEVGDEHLLLGIARQSSCVAARILLQLMWMNRMRHEVMNALPPPAESRPRSRRRGLRTLWRSPRDR
jgi:hypothetical protein